MVDHSIDFAVGDEIQDGPVEGDVEAREGFGIVVPEGLGVFFLGGGEIAVGFPEDGAWGRGMMVRESLFILKRLRE